MTGCSRVAVVMARPRLLVVVVVVALLVVVVDAKPTRGPHFDTSIKDYDNERTCWTGEVCKSEFQAEFRCKCSRWYWCRSPGRYYHAYCTMSALGYVWIQPGGLTPQDALQQ
ncbi:hypothetical protein OTU49_004417 [Cherax quadricarinatus]|uniref:Uncharacterized protein n=1 Tax=Cherax quadricarinatus TaxID=27406 RepID=A0AAW0Y9X6_CHEQU|nr:uncharacterized protein LOC128704823 [Cherax quadricarinatus]